MNRKDFFKILIAIPVLAVARKFVDVEEVPKIGTAEFHGNYNPIPIWYGDSEDMPQGFACRHEWSKVYGIEPTWELPLNIKSGTTVKILKNPKVIWGRY